LKISVPAQPRIIRKPMSAPTKAPLTTALWFLTALNQYARKSEIGSARRKPKKSPIKTGSPIFMLNAGVKAERSIIQSLLKDNRSTYVLLLYGSSANPDNIGLFDFLDSSAPAALRIYCVVWRLAWRVEGLIGANLRERHRKKGGKKQVASRFMVQS
jgi:hypothetical protein